VSNDCNRCCCKPNHPFKLEVRQYVPVPGDNVNSDFAHLSQELRNDWSRLTGGQKQSALLETYKRMPVLFTIQREDGQRCIACPCRCLSCFVCCGCCQDGVTVHAGTTVDMEGEKGRWVNGPVRETMLGRCVCGLLDASLPLSLFLGLPPPKKSTHSPAPSPTCPPRRAA